MITAAKNSDTTKFVASVIAEIGEIATLPEVTVRIIQIVENPKSTARDLHDVIKNDPALSARILKVVNSAFYGLPGQISNMDRAIVLLGLSAIKNIAIAASMTQLFNAGGQVEGFAGQDVWRHCIAVGVASRMITAAQGRPSTEEVFLAGLIHDLGLMVERQAFPKQLAEIVSRVSKGPANWCELENEIIGADHQAFGAALASKWRFPAHLGTAIGYHHKPMQVATVNRDLSVLVHIADVLAVRAGLGFTGTASGESYDEEMLGIIDLTQNDLEAVIAKLPEQVALTEAIFVP